MTCKQVVPDSGDAPYYLEGLGWEGGFHPTSVNEGVSPEDLSFPQQYGCYCEVLRLPIVKREDDLLKPESPPT